MNKSDQSLATRPLSDLLASREACQANVVFEGVTFPLAFTPAARETDNLLIKFHGAVDRDNPKRVPPIFVPADPGFGLDWHQLSISDPLLSIYKNLRISWFCGDHTRDVQALMPGLLKQVVHELGSRKRVYFGTSGGGFAALFNSARDPGSIALTLNPQIVLDNYYARLVQDYVTLCWPGAKSIGDVAGKRVTDLAKLYRKAPGNTVICVQNSTDPHHLYRHCGPLLDAVGARSLGGQPIDFISDISFWGKAGHQPAPAHVYQGWIAAIAAAKGTSGEAILKARKQQIEAATPGAQAQAAPRPAKAFASEDLALADAISKWSTT